MPIIRWLRLFVLGALAISASAGEASAQLVRSTVRHSTTLLPIEKAIVSARDKDGKILGTGTTDAFGDVELDLRLVKIPFELQVRRLGFSISRVEVKALQPADTVTFEFLMTEVAAVTEAVMVTADPGLNDRRLLEATRRGWKVYEPEVILRHRDQANNLHQLLQSLGNPGLILPRNVNDCVRSSRYDRCLAYIVDNQVWGNTALVLPADVYFIAILGASESRAQFGDRAPFGAIAIYTRSRIDRVQPPRLPDRTPSRRPPSPR